MTHSPDGTQKPEIPGKPPGGEGIEPQHLADVSTRWSLVRNAQVGDPSARELLYRTYYVPVKSFLRHLARFDEDRLGDLTQEFFTYWLEKDLLDRIRYEGSFRAFLKEVCRRFVKDRLGRRELPMESLPSDVAAKEQEIAVDLLDLEILKVHLDLALEETRRELSTERKAKYFDVLLARDFPGDRAVPSYNELAGTHQLSVSDVRNYLHKAREVLRRHYSRLTGETAN